MLIFRTQPSQRKVNGDQRDESDQVLSLRAHELANGEIQGHKITLSLYQYLQEVIESLPANCTNQNVKTNGVKHLSGEAARPGGESAALSFRTVAVTARGRGGMTRRNNPHRRAA